MFSKNKDDKKKDSKDSKDDHKKDKDKKEKDEKKGSDTPTLTPQKVENPPAPVVVTPKVVEDPKIKEEEERKRIEEEAAKKKREDELARKEKEEREKRRAERKAREAAEAAAAATDEKKVTEKAAPVVQDEVSEEVEIRSLESTKNDPNESKSAYREVFDTFPSEVYQAYDNLQGFARDLNTQVPVLEIAVVGPKSSGKSSIIEALIGRTVNVINASSKRPLFYQLVNNPELESPKVTIKRDSGLREFNHDIEVAVDDLQDAIAKRQKSTAEDPIFVIYEHKYVLNLTLIDTPGLPKSGEADSAQIETAILNICRPSHRLILAVEAARDGAFPEMTSFVKKVDPELSRTTFVFTKFFSQLQDFNSTRAVNRFLSGTVADVKTFYTTLPSFKVRAKFREVEKFQEKLWQAYRRDMNSLEQLQYDKRFERQIGVHALRRYLLNRTWRNFQDAIPRILKHLRSKKTQTEAQIAVLQAQSTSLDSSKLRSISSNYVTNFLQVIEQLLEGTSEGHPGVNGQTLEEEKAQQGDADWVDLYNHPVKFDAEDWGVPYWNSRLYGGQQFERLLAEFKAVADHSEISEVSMDDVATAAGINKLNNVPNYAWAASDLAQQKSQDVLVPLIEQLSERAVYIMKRLTDVADKVLEARRKKHHSSSPAGIDNIEQYHYFTHHVKDLYFKFVDQTAKTCKDKCMDEFLSTRTIYWDFTEFPNQSLPVDRNDQADTKTAVVKMSTDLFTTLRNRVSKNVLLKFYNFFLVPLQTDLWNETQEKVTCLSDQALEQIFEITATKDKLREDEAKLRAVLKKSQEQEGLFLEAATHFSHPIGNLN